jgi:disulfide bond formation protein DsbB
MATQTDALNQGEIDDTADTAPLGDALGLGSRYIALLTACLATGGSLFFSEVLGWLPCTLCWYQRIAMYPLTVLIAAGTLRRDNGLPLLVLPFSLTGAAVSLYHYLLIKTDWFPPPPCRAGVPCTVDYIDLFGFINIPFLALTTFLIITLMMIVARLAPLKEQTAGPPGPGARALLAPTALPVYAIIIVVVGAFFVGATLL